MAVNATKAAREKPFQILRTVFQAARAVTTPIQLISFTLAVLTTIVLFQANPTTNVLVFTILLLPFILLILIFNEKLLRRLDKGGRAPLLIAGLVIAGSFLLSGFVAISLARTSHEGLIESPSIGLLEPNKKAKVQRIRDATFKLNSYLDSHTLILRYYSRALGECLGPKAMGSSCDSAAQLQTELDELTAKLLSLKRATAAEIYGEDDIIGEVVKLQQAVLAQATTSSFVNGLWTHFSHLTNATAADPPLSNLVDSAGLGLTAPETASLNAIRASNSQADLIRALGREMVIKPLNTFQESDIAAAKTALRSLGYLSDRTGGPTDSDLLSRFRASLPKYVAPEEQPQSYLSLLLKGRDPQIRLLLLLHDAGLADIRKFLLRYAPERSRKVLERVFGMPIQLFTLDDVSRLSEAMLQQRGKPAVGASQSNLVILKIRDDFRDAFGNSPELHDALSSHTVEEYFMNVLRIAYGKTGSSTRFVFAPMAGPMYAGGRYANLLRELRAYYDVYETDLVIGALES